LSVFLLINHAQTKGHETRPAAERGPKRYSSLYFTTNTGLTVSKSGLCSLRQGDQSYKPNSCDQISTKFAV